MNPEYHLARYCLEPNRLFYQQMDRNLFLACLRVTARDCHVQEAKEERAAASGERK